VAARSCVSLDRNYTRAWFYLGLLYTKQERFLEAIDALRKVVNLEPDHPHAWLNLAHLHRRMGKSTEAGLAFAEYKRVKTARK
jgi:tetratricopeptide (TPR) repeat protein